ncbi:hypothetical protein ACF7P6_02145, partial [Staphylococcus aureus]
WNKKKCSSQLLLLQHSIDKKLSDDIQMNFDKVNQLLDKYKDNNGGYESFEKVSKKDRKAFADAVNALGEPLSKMAVITE